MVAAYSNGSTIIAPTPGSSALCSNKTNFVNLIHQADLQVNGKTIESTQPFVNVARHFQLLSEMSVNDLATMGHTLGFANTLDSVKSMRYEKTQAGAAGSGGNGMSNNRPIGEPDNATSLTNSQNSKIANSALQYKIGRYLDTVNNSNGLFGPNNLVTKTQLANEFRPYYEKNADHMIWYDFAVIKLEHIFESLSNTSIECPALFNCWAAASPAGPDPITAIFFPVLFNGGLALIQPSLNPLSTIYFSISSIETGGLIIPNTHAASQGAGQSLPVNSGKLLVECNIFNAFSHWLL